MGQLYDTYPHSHTTKGGQQVTISAYMPDRYPQGVGTNYIGEIEGYTYIPAMNEGRGGYREGGQGTPEDPNAPGPSTWDQVKPIAAAGGAYALGSAAMKPGGIKEIVSNVVDIPRDLYSWGKGSVEEAKGLLDGLTGAGASSASVGADGFVTSEAANAAWGGNATVPAEAGMLDLTGIGSAGNVILPAVGAVGAYDLLNRDFDKTGAGWARGIGQGAASGAAMGSYFGPLGAGIGAGIGGLIGLGKVAFGHKSTDQYHRERVSGLSNAAQNFFAEADKIAEQNNNMWTTGKYAGQKWSFEKATDLAKEDPTHFIGNLGNFETFGDKWFGTPLDKQKSIVSRLVNEGLYTNNKGDVIIHSDNQSRANQIYDEEMGISSPEEEEEENQNG